MLTATKSFLPRRPRGRQTEITEAAYYKHLRGFCALMLEIYSGMDFRVGVRGWCYLVEKSGLLKGDFSDAERLITNCRKSGDLPLDICAEDDSRETILLEDINPEDDPEREAENWINWLLQSAHITYKPISFWDDLNVYIKSQSRSSTCATCCIQFAANYTSQSRTSKVGMTLIAAQQ